MPKDGAADDDQNDTVVKPDIFIVCDPPKLDNRGMCGAPTGSQMSSRSLPLATTEPPNCRSSGRWCSPPLSFSKVHCTQIQQLSQLGGKRGRTDKGNLCVVGLA